ncbi:bifunctional 2',3'-cyclic-nucleotide 2'-phosphodiesterase/3'-nucleotidase [Thioclava sp. SK-1]|uniref:bifunctional 2',3'-cyclic-nucleotide 2'-phosphodiesterase/3'-nucleotidase n=1 Tax=Thioclava sp. SK-1 TaxID=1889770 RepID=UPI000AA79A5F|nr:bifunctional 2',3'-cyclic-nucleotide 2'-phosphodiesterase/3'-nucleotidase [Thioclava sp. SK-1]
MYGGTFQQTSLNASVHAQAGARIALRLMETTDLHGHLRGYDYARDCPNSSVGLSRIATLVEQLRADHPNTLLFDNGDALQGTPLTDFYARERALSATDVHPFIAAMNTLRYDAGTPGNHEFDYGLVFLQRILRDTAHPMVCANVLTAHPEERSNMQHVLPPWVILQRDMVDDRGNTHLLRIGVIGVLPPQVTLWNRLVLDDRISAQDMVEATRAHLPCMRANGVDLIIALAHTGIEPDQSTPGLPPQGAENVALHLAQLDDIDVVLCGHDHVPFPQPDATVQDGIDPLRGTLAGKPAVSAGRWGSHLGVIDLTLEQAPDGWKIATAQSRLEPIFTRSANGEPQERVPESPAILRLSETAHNEVLDHVRTVIGTLKGHLHSYFSAIKPDAALSLIASAKLDYLDFALRDRPEATLPRLAVASPFKCGGRGGPDYFLDIAPGVLSVRNIMDILPFPNRVATIITTGQDVKEWLERSARIFSHLTQGIENQSLLNNACPIYNFDTLFGLTYTIDPTQPARYDDAGYLTRPGCHRIHDIRYQGQPIDPEQKFVVATNDHRAGLGTPFTGMTAETLNLGRPITVRALVSEYVQRCEEIAPQAADVWTFAHHPNTSAVFNTSPRARDFLAQMPGQTVTPLALTPSGFLQMRLNF